MKDIIDISIENENLRKEQEERSRARKMVMKACCSQCGCDFEMPEREFMEIMNKSQYIRVKEKLLVCPECKGEDSGGK